jgi:hypothetical protein
MMARLFGGLEGAESFAAFRSTVRRGYSGVGGVGKKCLVRRVLKVENRRLTLKLWV